MDMGALSRHIKSIFVFLGAVQLLRGGKRKRRSLFYFETGSPHSPARMASDLRMTF